jgi:hypothetical protein
MIHTERFTVSGIQHDYRELTNRGRISNGCFVLNFYLDEVTVLIRVNFLIPAPFSYIRVYCLKIILCI